MPTKPCTPETFEAICVAISESSFGTRYLCKQHNVTRQSFFDMINESKQTKDRYAHAKTSQAHYLAEEIIEISDDGTNDWMTVMRGDESVEVENKESINRSRLRVDTRKWIAARLAPESFGDKIETTLKGDKESPLHVITGMVVK